MKKIRKLIDEYKLAILISFIVAIVIHLPLFTKNILTADVLLNTGYYSGYSWEISLGRFGLYVVGLLKGFLVIPQLEIFLSILLFIGSIILIFDLFEIKNKVIQILCGILVSVSPIVSATLLFHYCSFAYSLAFFLSVLAIYLFVKSKHKFVKYVIPSFLITLSLSMYQAYLAIPLTLLLLWWMIQILKKKFHWKEFFISFGIIVLAALFYFILMKLSLLVFHVDLSSYRGASQFGIDTILDIPSRIINAYQSFYQYYFTDSVVSNSNMFMQVFYIVMFILLFIGIGYSLYQNKVSLKYSLLFILFLILIPVFVNIVVIILPDTEIQLLMSSAYLLIFFFGCYFMQDKKVFSILIVFLFIFMIRGYIIQDSATYQTLEHTYKKTYSIASDIRDQINELGHNKQVMIVGSLDQNEYYNKEDSTELNNISTYTYGFVSNYSLFWDEYTNMKNGWSRFMEQELGASITFVSSDTYQEILDSSEYQKMECYPSNKSIQLIDDVIVVKLAN